MDNHLKNERQNIDLIMNQTMTQLVELENENSKLKSLIEALFHDQEAHGNMNVEVPEALDFKVPHGMLCMTRSYFQMAVDTYCGTHVVMRFKVHKLKELYSDLEMFDFRASFRLFEITRPTTSIEFRTFMCH